jgi:hypothetical protein
MSVGEHRKIIARMEAFAWSHWKNKEPGCMRSRFITLEGQLVERSFFFENDESGLWRIRIERKEVFTNYGPPDHKFILRNTAFVYSVERLKARMVINTPEAYKDSDQAIPGDYSLSGKSKEGEQYILWEPDNTSN